MKKNWTKRGVAVVMMAVFALAGVVAAQPKQVEAKLFLGVYGDVNKDSIVNAQDALLILERAANIRTFTDEQFTAADMNNDFCITAADALMVLQKAAGM